MSPNHYGAFLEDWKNNLIIVRARRMGLSGHDLLDAQQELVLHVARFRYEPVRSNGASEATALTALIDRRLKALRRAEARYNRHQQRARDHHANRSADDANLWPYVDRHLLVVDVREAVARLDPQEQLVCQLRGQGHSVESIAAHLGCGWHTVDRKIEHIGVRFRAMGLDGWIIKD